ncbi:Acyl carrier protein [compost metagenome]
MNELAEDQKEKLHVLIADTLICDLEDVTEEGVSIRNLGADSLDEVELVMKVEKEFDITINDDVAEGIVLVSDYYPIIANLI